MKFVETKPFADPQVAARKLLELANAFEPVQDGRIYIEKINCPFLFELKGTPAEYKAGLQPSATAALSGLGEFPDCPRACNRPYRAGRSPDRVKVKNRKHPAMNREL
jgi:hypothetical protein